MTSPRRATFLRRVAIVFVTAWAVRSLIVSGDAVLNEHFRSALVTPPWATQAVSGDGFEQSLIHIRDSLPSGDRVVVVWNNPPDYWYAYFWSTFWLFPRKVTIATTFNPPSLQDADALMVVRRPLEAPPDFGGFTPSKVYLYPDYVVTTYVRNG